MFTRKMRASLFATIFAQLLTLFWARSSLAQSLASNATAATVREEEIRDVRNYIVDNGPLQICIADWMPLVSCDPSQPTSSYSGHDVEMFRLAAEKLGLARKIKTGTTIAPVSAISSHLSPLKVALATQQCVVFLSLVRDRPWATSTPIPIMPLV